MTVRRVGVGPGIDGASRGGRDALLPPPGAQEQNGRYDGDHEDEAGHGDPDGEISRGYAQLILLVLIQGLTVKETSVPIVRRVRHVEAAKDFDGGVLSKERVVDAVLGNGTARLGLTLLPAEVVAFGVA